MMELLTESSGWKALLDITEQEEDRVTKNFNEMLQRHFLFNNKQEAHESDIPGCFHEVVHWEDENKYEMVKPQTRWSRLRSIWQVLGMGQGDDTTEAWTDKEIIVFLFACLGHVWKPDVRKAFANEEDEEEEEIADDIIKGEKVFFDDLKNCVLILPQRRTRQQLVPPLPPLSASFLLVHIP